MRCNARQWPQTILAAASISFIFVLGTSARRDASAQPRSRVVTYDGFMVSLSEGSGAGSFGLISDRFGYVADTIGIDNLHTTVDGKKFSSADPVGRFVHVVASEMDSNQGSIITAVSIRIIGRKHLVIAE